MVTMMDALKMALMSVSSVIAAQVRDILHYRPVRALRTRTTMIMKRIAGQNGLVGHHGEPVTVRVVMGNRQGHARALVEWSDRVHVPEMVGKTFRTATLKNVQLGENGEDGHSVTRLVTPANRFEIANAMELKLDQTHVQKEKILKLSHVEGSHVHGGLLGIIGLHVLEHVEHQNR